MISAIILTKNEEKNIKACLENLAWCDEIIVVDDNSTDKTVEIAKKKGARVIIHSLNNSFAAQRNYALEKAKGDWILFIDADEVVPPALWYEIMSHTNNPVNEFSGFYIRRKDILWKKELHYGETGNIKIVRLAKKGTGNWINNVHEVWKVKGKVGTLNNHLLHYPHDSVKDFLSEINYYTDLRAEELHRKNKKSNWLAILTYPSAKFILNYIIRRGFLDGIQGLIIAMMMSFHSFLVRSKLWHIGRNKTS